jgi:hypothetical protein
MVGRLASVASLTVALLILATPAAAQPITGHTASDDFLETIFIGSVAEGRIGDRGESSDVELLLGQLFPLDTDQFDWVSGRTYSWTLSYEPGSIGGAVSFDFEGTNLFMATATEFNSFFIRAAAERPNTRILVNDLVLGPPPSEGSGGATVFESANPLVPASSAADGNGATLDVLKISGVDLLIGFTLQGKVAMFFDAADAPPTGSELSFQAYVAVAPDFPDADADGVEDSIDNCVNTANPGQEDDDKDGPGDACDNCPFDANPGQEDGDDDGAGDACDNCLQGCTAIFPAAATCANPDQFDTDGDLVGDRCDNCRIVQNGPDEAGIPGVGDQTDSNGNLIGDACEPSTVILDLGASVSVSGGFSASSSSTLGVFSSALLAQTAIDISLSCAQDVVAANIGLALPAGTTFVNFGGCIPNAADPNNLASCVGATDLGITVNPLTSTTIGPAVANPAGFPTLNVLLQLQATPGVNNDLLCDGGGTPQEIFLGKLLLDNLPLFTAPQVSTEGFSLFDPDLELLVAPSGNPFPDAQLLTVVIPETELATLTLRPATPGDLRRYKVTVLSERRIHKMAFGITTSNPAVAPVFGGCDCASGDTTNCPIADFPAQVGDVDLTGCAFDDGTNPNLDLGSGIARPTLFTGDVPLIATFVAQATGPSDPQFVENTIYVALEGILPAGADPPSINNPSAIVESELGIIEFGEDTPTPQITFAGADLLPGFSPGGQVVPSSTANPIAVENVSLLNRFDADEDLDGDGVGDDSDNCVLTANGGLGGQQDNGGVAILDADDIGDVCQCGDSGDGVVDIALLTAEDDVANCQAVLALPPGETATNPVAEKCRVTIGGTLNIVDLVLMELEAASIDSGLPDSSARLQACGPATELQ